MNKTNLKSLRYIIIAFGFFVLLIAPFVIFDDFIHSEWIFKYSWVAILSIYAFAVLPWISNISISIKDINLIVTGAIYYRGLSVYTAITIFIVSKFGYFANKPEVIWLFQFAALIVFFLTVYLGSINYIHMNEVQEKEKEKLDGVKRINDLANELLINYENNRNDEIVKKVKSLSEKLKYLAPSENETAKEIEVEIVDILEVLNYRSLDSSNSVLNSLETLETLYKKRKAIY